MPCTDGGPSHQDYDRLHTEIRELTALLCEACAEWGGEMPTLLKLWKNKHEAIDAERHEAQKRQRAESIARLERQGRQIQAELAALKK